MYAILTAPKTAVSLPYKLVQLIMGSVERERERPISKLHGVFGMAMSRGEAVGLFGFCTGSAQRS
jgi:hypothetical protein